MSILRDITIIRFYVRTLSKTYAEQNE